MRLIANKSITFGGKVLHAGDSFDAVDWAAKALVFTKVARPEGEPPEAASEPPKRRGRPPKYQRRDMVAES